MMVRLQIVYLKTICAMLNVHTQASLFRRITVVLRGMLLKRRVKTKINSASSLSVTDNLLELGKINKLVHYNVVSRLSKEATTQTRDWYDMRWLSYAYR